MTTLGSTLGILLFAIGEFGAVCLFLTPRISRGSTRGR
jgi:hypothetical protein